MSPGSRGVRLHRREPSPQTGTSPPPKVRTPLPKAERAQTLPARDGSSSPGGAGLGQKELPGGGARADQPVPRPCPPAITRRSGAKASATTSHSLFSLIIPPSCFLSLFFLPLSCCPFHSCLQGPSQLVLVGAPPAARACADAAFPAATLLGPALTGRNAHSRAAGCCREGARHVSSQWPRRGDRGWGPSPHGAQEGEDWGPSPCGRTRRGESPFRLRLPPQGAGRSCPFPAAAKRPPLGGGQATHRGGGSPGLPVCLAAHPTAQKLPCPGGAAWAQGPGRLGGPGGSEEWALPWQAWPPGCPLLCVTWSHTHTPSPLTHTTTSSV